MKNSRDYGKINYAEIKVAPLTLFVGDNNSGKSYLMSLLWGIKNFGVAALIQRYPEEKTKTDRILNDWMIAQVKTAWKNGSHAVGIGEVADELQQVLDQGVKRNKDNLVKRIFNSSEVKIKELKIELQDIDKIFLHFQRKPGIREKDDRLLLESSAGSQYIMNFSGIKREQESKIANPFWIHMLISLVTGIEIGDVTEAANNLYFPTARTGFVLTKNIINKMGRNMVFNRFEGEEEEITPFTRPINQFLDVINDLAFAQRGKDALGDIAANIEGGMAEGVIEMSALPNKEVFYVPAGQEEAFSLGVSSAVVTELSPLVLTLKHKKTLNFLFYEEPEVCLHPQLQQKMARVICQVVNAGVNMMVTTHSDIILQHINNMVCLSGRTDRDKICCRFGYDVNDLLDAGQITVYQLKAKPGEKTVVESLMCGKNGFAVPTFNDTLDQLMDEAYEIQE
ncbi:MAG: AAA family ATPase [Lachnospiraceae bacterium]|nr:AAA family ATPase [Lachnospiraceae bacterium]